MTIVLLLGGTGKLGRCVLKELLCHTYELGLLIRNQAERSKCVPEHLVVFEGDITIASSINPAVEWADVVINCSGLVSYKKSDRAKLRLINVEGVKNLGGHDLTCDEVFVALKQVKPYKSPFLSNRIVQLYSIMNDYILHPLLGYFLITGEFFKMANHFHFTDSLKAMKRLNYKLSSFEASLKEII